ncbi:hypothetical protein [Streptococcus suis]|uniref:hypothetical protein n=1 Tax=Streptococcus suis TaxID=1307 RepID=UPI0028A98263|nr:hypothetical protein [Streptococcus suis]WNN04168.1 hypothetical protein RMQ63_03340 [Streptococcus suis]WNO80190.1 hypothetical protein RMP65_07965 [Streptococcus suis]HEL1546047.1 hypothetical protein [Streptococcus suis]HEL1552564.1 hypothetical protein [Streptococcus suis]HEL2308605.1 hypothetical protein [Streptococcus suis]
MKKNVRQALISTLIFIPLFVLFQLWGNSGANILHIISQAKFWVQLLIAGTIYFLGLTYLLPVIRRKLEEDKE